ncbi:DinB/UmuC family translesion DNA polymerase [Candidatus Frankia nodulisporulans]|uniref:DinB/UmuC family translesion DNA polymerase n=1 Tax=Candidatus Frankia nodulisporulans TaxID=2060052 RepID=UPI003703954B
MRTVTHSRTLHGPTDVTRTVHATAVALDQRPSGDGYRTGVVLPAVRLLGVHAGNLVAAGTSGSQFRLGERSASWAELDQVTDRARSRFGAAVLGPVSPLNRPGLAGGPAAPRRSGASGRREQA